MPRLWQRTLLAAWAVSGGLASNATTGSAADDFSPDFRLTFALAAGRDDFFYEDGGDGDALPTRLLGRLQSSVSSVSLVVRDAGGSAVFEHKEGTEVEFAFDVATSGTYSFGVSNHDPAASAIVTLAVGRQGSSLQSHYLRDLQTELAHLDPLLADIQGEAAYVWVRRLSHMGNVESLYARVLAFCFMKLIVLVSMACFQAFYVEGLFHPETESSSSASYSAPQRKSQLFSNDYHRKSTSLAGSLGARRRSANTRLR